MKNWIKNIFYYLSLIIIVVNIITAFILNNRAWSLLTLFLVTAALITLIKELEINYIFYLAVCLLILIGLLSTYYGRPDSSISFRGNLINKSTKLASRAYELFSGENFFRKSLEMGKNENYVPGSWEPPEDYQMKTVKLDKSRAYFLNRKESKNNKLIYYLHGGAYLLSFQKRHNEAALKYSKAYNNADVFALDYRTAPSDFHPSALEDAFEGYSWLLDQGYQPEQIIIAGDSAGGGLALALTLKLRDQDVPMPKLLLLSSPWTDLSAEGESYQTKITADPIFGSLSQEKAPKYPVPITYAGNKDLKDPYLSPAFADYKNMPPLLIQVGSEEVLLSDSKKVAKAAEKAGIPVELTIYQGMFHNFMLNLPDIPEGRAAWLEIEEFINKYN